VSDGSGLCRGDRNRNAGLARLRRLLPLDDAIVGIDLADDRQAAVVADYDSRVIARRRLAARAWELGELLDWALARAIAAGFASVTVACEPHELAGFGSARTRCHHMRELQNAAEQIAASQDGLICAASLKISHHLQAAR